MPLVVSTLKFQRQNVFCTPICTKYVQKKCKNSHKLFFRHNFCLYKNRHFCRLLRDFMLNSAVFCAFQIRFSCDSGFRFRSFPEYVFFHLRESFSFCFSPLKCFRILIRCLQVSLEFLFRLRYIRRNLFRTFCPACLLPPFFLKVRQVCTWSHLFLHR